MEALLTAAMKFLTQKALSNKSGNNLNSAKTENNSFGKTLNELMG